MSRTAKSLQRQSLKILDVTSQQNHPSIATRQVLRSFARLSLWESCQSVERTRINHTIQPKGLCQTGSDSCQRLWLRYGEYVEKHLLKGQIPLARGRDAREEILKQASEDDQILCQDLGDVEVPQGAEEHISLHLPCLGAEQTSSHHQHRFDGSQTPVIMPAQHSLKSQEEEQPANIGWTCQQQAVKNKLCTKNFK